LNNVLIKPVRERVSHGFKAALHICLNNPIYLQVLKVLYIMISIKKIEESVVKATITSNCN